MPPLLLRRVFLGVVACDSLVFGLWLVFDPTGLFDLLRVPPRDLILARGLGTLFLAHVPCLVLAAWRPGAYRNLALVPLLGRALLAGLWGWLLASDRITPWRPALLGLLALALVWLPGLAWSLRPAKQARRASAGEGGK